MPSSILWFLSEVISQEQYSDLDLEAAKAILAKIPSEEIKTWYYWHEGRPNWTPVTEAAELLLPRSKQPPPLPSLETHYLSNSSKSRKPDVIRPVLKADFQIRSALSEPVADNDPQDKRKHRRHKVRLKVIVVSETQTFRSFTKNISLGGLLLENKVPWSVSGGQCKVYISSPDGNETIEFSAQVLSDPKNACRIMFERQNPVFNAILSTWLEVTLSSMRKAG